MQRQGQWIDVVVLDGQHGLQLGDLFGGTAPGAPVPAESDMLLA